MVVGWQYANKQRPPQLKHRSNFSSASILFKPILLYMHDVLLLVTGSVLAYRGSRLFSQVFSLQSSAVGFVFCRQGSPHSRETTSFLGWSVVFVNMIICHSISTVCTVEGSHRSPRSVDVTTTEITITAFLCEKQQSSRRVCTI